MATIQKFDDETIAIVQAAERAYRDLFGAGSNVNLRELQYLQHEWQYACLPPTADRSLQTMVLGVTEEVAWELLDSIVRGEERESYDALGDFLVYACSICTLLELDFHTLTEDFDAERIQHVEHDRLFDLLNNIGQLAHIAGKQAQKTRGYDDIAKVRLDAGCVLYKAFLNVQNLAFAHDWDAGVLFAEVVTEVMKRNWNTNKVDGAVQTTLQLEEKL